MWGIQVSISRYGGVIAAADEASAFPLRQSGGTTAVRRIVMNFQQAGIFPIVVLSGAQEEEVRNQLASSGVIFLRPKGTRSELFQSVKTGLTYLQDLCEKIVFTPVNTPMFTPQTLDKLMRAEGDIVSPSCCGRSGHPLIVSARMVPDLLAYRGTCGLRGAVAALQDHRVWVEVEDQGVLYTVHHGDVPPPQMARYNKEVLHLAARLHLQKDVAVFDSRTKLLLLLIWKTQSVRAACQQMALSYSKAWELLNLLEDSLELPLVERRHGGARGGRTVLTEKGLLFLRQYQRIEEDLLRYTQEKYSEFWASMGKSPASSAEKELDGTAR